MKSQVMLLVIVLMYVSISWSQPFQQETNTIPVEIYGWYPYSTWAGGHNLSKPELCDIDADGDRDFFVGDQFPTFGYFKNNGSAYIPQYDWITDSYQSLSVVGVTGGSSPTFGDLDNDDDLDLIMSGSSNRTRYYENIGSPTQAVFEVRYDTLLDNQGDPVYSQKGDLVDIDADGDYDFFGGRYFGVINFYRNIGTPDSFSFFLEEFEFDSINVGDDASPNFVDLDRDGDFDLLIGTESGNIWYYENTGDSINWNFNFITSQFCDIDVYMNATPEASDIDSDGDYDLFSGRYANIFSARGDIFFWENQGNPERHDFHYITGEYLTLDEGDVCATYFGDIDADSDFDMLTISGTDMSFYRNTGDASNPNFVLETEQYQNLSFYGGDPVLYDLDADGDLDLLSGEGGFYEAEIKIYTNTGTAQQANFLYRSSVVQPGALGSAIDVVDIDGDSDGDLFFSDGWGDFYFFENIGTPNLPDFTFVTQNFQNISNPTILWPTFNDWDQDGDFDLFMGGVFNGQYYGIAYYENTGTISSPNLQIVTNDFFGGEYGTRIFVIDIDSDSDHDFFFDHGHGGMSFIRNLAVTAVPPLRRHPQAGLQLSLGPNPANPVTWVSFHLPAPQKATLAVYNLLGQKVANLAQGLQPPGTNTYLWNASQFSSGVYVIRLETENEDFVRQVTVLK